MRPLQVYLDSSDFSDFSKPTKSDAYDDIERKLVAWSGAGLIEIRFSYLHVVEASPVKPEDINSSSLRLQKMLHLCGKRCFPSTISIIEREISRPGEWRSATYLDWLYREDGDWLPDIDDLGIDSSSPYVKLRKEIRNTAPDRATRRKMERQYFDQQGKPKPAAKARFLATQAATAKKLEERFPLPPGAAQQLAECLAKDDDTKFQLLLRKSLNDLSCWPDWYKHHWDRVDPISSLLRRSSRALNECFAVTALELWQAHSAGLKNGLMESELNKILWNSYKKAASSMYGDMVRRFSGMQGIKPAAIDQKSSCDMRPGLATALAVQRQIMLRNMGLTGRPREADEGDFGDVLHCVHLPFVDFFRTDGFIASAISEAKIPFPTKVVPKLLQLPAAIEARLKEIDGV